mgnify:CR=1 FL=1
MFRVRSAGGRRGTAGWCCGLSPRLAGGACAGGSWRAGVGPRHRGGAPRGFLPGVCPAACLVLGMSAEGGGDCHCALVGGALAVSNALRRRVPG